MGSGGGSVGRFRHQRSAVRIPTSANFIYKLYIEIEKTKIKKKRQGMAHLKIKNNWADILSQSSPSMCLLISLGVQVMNYFYGDKKADLS